MAPMQDYEEGWHAISLYTGRPVTELQQAAELGELRCCGDRDHPRACHRQLRIWARVRYLELFNRRSISHSTSL